MSFQSEAQRNFFFAKKRADGLLESIQDHQKEKSYKKMWSESPSFVPRSGAKTSMPQMSEQEKSEWAAWRGEFGQK